jgi:hypothetical protein
MNFIESKIICKSAQFNNFFVARKDWKSTICRKNLWPSFWFRGHKCYNIYTNNFHEINTFVLSLTFNKWIRLIWKRHLCKPLQIQLRKDHPCYWRGKCIMWPFDVSGIIRLSSATTLLIFFHKTNGLCWCIYADQSRDGVFSVWSDKKTTNHITTYNKTEK